MDTKTAIRIGYDDVLAVVGDEASAQRMWAELSDRSVQPFEARRMFMWFGGVLALLSATVLLGTAGVTFGAVGFAFVLTLVMTGVLGAGWYLKQNDQHLAGGLLATVFLGLVPLLVFSVTDLIGLRGDGFFNYDGFYHYIDSQWVWMEIITILLGLVVVWKFDFGFATLPPTIAAYFFAMDFGELVSNAGFETLAIAVGFGIGAILLALAVALQRSGKVGHATWLLIYGLLSVLFGASQVTNGGTAGALLYLLLGLAFIVFGWAIKRAIPITIGGLTTTCAISYFAFDYFNDSILFSLVLFAIGIGMVAISSRIVPKKLGSAA